MQVLSITEIEEVSGGEPNAGQFAGAVAGIASAAIVVCTAPAWGAAAGVLGIAAIGFNMLGLYM